MEWDLGRFGEEKGDWVILRRGMGLETVVDMGEKIGVKDEFVEVIGQGKGGCWG